MSTDIFISYAREDRSRVKPLAQLLQAEGWSVWWDPEIPVGRSFDEVIEEALDAARCVIVVWTETSVGSRWVKTEAEEGLHRQILAPVLMDEVRLPLAFRRIQAANLVGWEEGRQHPGVDQLVNAVSRIAGSPEAPEPEEEDEPPRTVAIVPEPEGQGEAIPDEIASEKEASLAESEDISHPEDVEPEVEPVEAKQAGAASIDDEQTVAMPPGGHVVSPKEEPTSPEKRVPARLARWVKEPKRLALVAAVAGLVVIALVVVFAILNGDSSDNSPQPVVDTIEIDPPEAMIEVGSTVQLTATLRDSLGKQLDEPTDWESSDPSIASVDSAGVVTGVKADSTQIIARSDGVEEGIKITVFARKVTPAPAAVIEVTPSRVSLQRGEREQLRATLKDAGGNTLSGRAVNWTSNEPSIASVSQTGVVAGLREGSATITAKSEAAQGTARVSVSPASVAAIEIAPSRASLQVGDTRQLRATLKDADGNQLSGRSVEWTSSNTSVASVSQAGVVAGLREGSATITAKSEAAQGTARVRVSPAPRTETPPQGIPNIAFVQIPVGNFQMGSTNGDDDEQPVHTVRLSSFSMSATEVTQGQWKAVMGDNPSYFEGEDLPVEQVSWDDVQTFIRRLNTLQGCRRCYRLPTEAEWEYAARAGTTGDYAGDLDAMGWYVENSGRKTHPVRQKRRNAWGLYDMHGNVWEWVADWYGHRYPSGTVTDPTGPETGSRRVSRGGSWGHTAGSARSADRGNVPPGFRDSYLGFRLVRTGL